MAYKIAMLLDAWEEPFNGTVVSTQRFVTELQKQDYEFTILAAGEGEEHPGPERVVGFPYFSLPGINGLLKKMRFPLAWPKRERLRETLRGVDLLHIQAPFFLAYSALAVARDLGIPVVFSFHVQPENLLRNLHMNANWLAEGLYKFWIRYFYQRADLVVCPSHFAAELLASRGLSTPIKVISNGVPSHHIATLDDLESSAGDRVEGRFALLSVGRLALEKRQHMIIEAVAASRYVDQIDLVLVGTGPNEKQLQTLAAKKLANPVQIGCVSDAQLRRLYNAADLFVHAGEAELEGMSTMEAIANGKAVVVSNSPGSAARQFALDDNSQFNCNDIADLTQKIDYWLGNPVARLRAGEENRKLAESYHHSASVAALHAVYTGILTGGEQAAPPEQKATAVPDLS